MFSLPNVKTTRCRLTAGRLNARFASYSRPPPGRSLYTHRPFIRRIDKCMYIQSRRSYRLYNASRSFRRICVLRSAHRIQSISERCRRPVLLWQRAARITISFGVRVFFCFASALFVLFFRPRPPLRMRTGRYAASRNRAFANRTCFCHTEGTLSMNIISVFDQITRIGWLGSRVVSVLDSGAEGPGSNRDAVG